MLEILIIRIKGGEWVAVFRVLGLVVSVELGECGRRSIDQGQGDGLRFNEFGGGNGSPVSVIFLTLTMPAVTQWQA